MARGPAPIPAGLRIIQGTDRRGRSGRRLDRSKEPRPLEGPPEPPYALADEVRQVWDRVVAHLAEMGLASPADADLLAVFCEAVVLHRKASRLIAKSSVLVRGSRSLIVHKAIMVQREAANTVRLLGQEFGLSPAARTRVEVLPRDSGYNPFA